MSYLPSTPVKYCQIKTASTATGFSLHLWDCQENQDAEFSTKGNAKYNNTPLKGMYFSNWTLLLGGLTADYNYNCKYNTVDDATTFTGYTSFFTNEPDIHKNSYMGSMNQYLNGVNYPSLFAGTINAVGQPMFRLNFWIARNSTSATMGTNSHRDTHIFLLPVSENK